MAEEIKVVVKSEQQGDAFAKTEQEIQRLYQAANAYESKGMPDAAKSARGDALSLQKDIVRAKREEAAVTKAIAATEKERSVFSGRTRYEMMTLARELATGVPSGRTVSSLVGNVFQDAQRARSAALAGDGEMAGAISGMLPRLLMGAGVMAAVVGAAAVATKVYIGQADQERALQNKLGAERRSDERGLAIAGTWRGTSSQVVSQSFKTQDEIFELKNQRKQLEDEAQSGMSGHLDRTLGTDFFTQGAGWYKPDSARAIEKNEAEIARLEKRNEEEIALASEKFKTEEDGLDLQILRDVNKHSTEGMRDKLVHAAEKDWIAKYRSVMAQSNDDKLATEAANLTVKEEEWQIGRRLASGLVTARSGAADVARAASIDGGFHFGPDVAKKIDAFHETVKRNSAKMEEISSRIDHSGA